MAKKPATDAPTKTSDVPIDQAILAADFVPIDKLIGYARNARTHSDAQVAQLAAAIAEFGWTNPVLADAQGIVAGHGRVMAARKLYDAGQAIKLPSGLEIPAGTVPVLDCTGWSDTKRRAYILADNQLALNAGWDAELLKLEIADLQASDFDFDLLGFDQNFIGDLMGTVVHFGKTDPDETPEPPAVPVSRLGDVWIMGPHRIICGDSTNAEDVKRVLDGAVPNLMVTDPPYGVEYDPKWRDDLGTDWVGQADKKRQRVSTHPNAKPDGKGRALGKVENDDRADWSEAWALFPGAIAYVWHGGLHAAVVSESLQSQKFAIRSQIIWVKQHFVFSRGDYHWQHEPCWYAVRGTGNWKGDRKQTTVWEIQNASAFHGQKDDQTTGHGTQKPVECMRRPIENNSGLGEAIYEPFSGSGTTLIACQMMNRHFRGLEINPAYVDVAVARWEKFTGEAAVLEGSAKSFTEVMAERSGARPGPVAEPAAEAKPEKKARAAKATGAAAAKAGGPGV